jgi:hypothetical protein
VPEIGSLVFDLEKIFFLCLYFSSITNLERFHHTISCSIGIKVKPDASLFLVLTLYNWARLAIVGVEARTNFFIEDHVIQSVQAFLLCFPII